MENLFYLLISILAAAGAAIAFNIHSKKAADKHLACPLRGHCDVVVKSEYSKFFGIPVEYLGFAYYSIVCLSYLTFFIFPKISMHNLFALGVASVTACAFMFSIYLTSIQAFILKVWCTWCIASALICTAIFFLVVQSAIFDMIPYLAQYKGILVGAHLIGVVLGFGAAIIADVFFFKSVRDGAISHNESDILRTLSQIVWAGVVIIIASGFLIFLSDIDRYSHSAKFLTKMFAVGVIVVNGTLLHMFITPNLTRIPFGNLESNGITEMRNHRRLAFALGAVSITSWWTAFILGLLRFSPASLPIMIGAYLGILFSAVLASQIVEELFFRIKSRKRTEDFPSPN